ncbi:programmed cell death protein 2, partial [Syncephalis plumigaleata]
MSLNTKQDIKHKKLDVHYEWPVNLPAFKHYWLDIEAESLEQSCLEKLKEKYAKYMDLQAMEELAMTNSTDQESNEWESEQYEKSWKPKGFDKAFKRLQKSFKRIPNNVFGINGRVNHYSTHIKMRWHHFYTIPSSSAIPSCPVCGATRIFELQLMPSLLSALATSTYRHANDQRHNHDPAAMMDSLDMGMEWGTIFVFTCENDCFSADTLADCSSIEDGAIRFHEELVLLQH